MPSRPDEAQQPIVTVGPRCTEQLRLRPTRAGVTMDAMRAMRVMRAHPSHARPCASCALASKCAARMWAGATKTLRNPQRLHRPLERSGTETGRKRGRDGNEGTETRTRLVLTPAIGTGDGNEDAASIDAGHRNWYQLALCQGTETRTRLVLTPAIGTGTSWRYVKNSESRTRRPRIPRPEPVGGQGAHVPQGG
jgi:hypothetical protein